MVVHLWGLRMQGIRYVAGMMALVLLLACEDSKDSNGVYSVDCSTDGIYAPANAPIVTPASAGATTTVLVLHGKTGSPNSAHLQPFYTELAAAGYEVIAPFMPWGGTTWDGSMCEAMNYITTLAGQEAAKGKDVMLAGHSMGGAHALIYGVSSPSSAVQGIVALAPGHMVHQSNRTQEVTATSVSLAKEMRKSGNGDVLATFDILNNGTTSQITASANDYLSYHDLNEFPNMSGVLPSISLPVLWLAGEGDSLTATYNMSTLASQINSPGSEYQLVSGSHTSMVENSSAPVITWWEAL